MNQQKHCDTCMYSDRPMRKNAYATNSAKAQHCTSAGYNSENYTHEMMMEDWGKGYCRFWTPKKERTEQYEKQLFHRPTQ